MLNQDLQSTVFSPVKEFMCTKLHLVFCTTLRVTKSEKRNLTVAEDCTDDEQEA